MITFNNSDLNYNLRDKKRIRLLISKLFIEERFSLKGLSIVFTSDEYLLELNKKFLNHNYYTDILTFDLLDEQKNVLGELYISIERTKENGKLNNCSHHLEILRVIIHGCLHLCGYKDHSKNLKNKIHKREDYYLQKYLTDVSRGT